MQSTYAASIMRDRRRSIISFRRTNFPSDITAFARLTFLPPPSSFSSSSSSVVRAETVGGKKGKRGRKRTLRNSSSRNSAIFHNDIARREFNSPLIIIIITAKHEIFRYPPLLTFTFLFETCVFYLYFFSTERRTKLENFHRECSSAGRVERRRNRRETASSVQMHCVCGYIVLVRARFRFCPSVRSFVPRCYSLPCKTFNGEQEGGEKKRYVSSVRNKTVYIRLGSVVRTGARAIINRGRRILKTGRNGISRGIY